MPATLLMPLWLVCVMAVLSAIGGAAVVLMFIPPKDAPQSVLDWLDGKEQRDGN